MTMVARLGSPESLTLVTGGNCHMDTAVQGEEILLTVDI
jgi:hypothetical protein